MNESCIGIRGSVDPEIELIDLEIGRRKPLLSRPPDHPITRSLDRPITLSPHHPITRSSDQTGFTLFEMLLSITLIGFLMAALLVGLRVASRAWRTGEARLRQVHAEAERNVFLVQQISSLVPYRVKVADPDLTGTFLILQASAKCLRFVSSYSSVFRSRSGLVLAEYSIVDASPGNVEVALRETPVGDNDLLLRRIVRKVTNDPDTGAPVIDYQPFSVSETDLPLMTGLREAWFEYLDLHPEKATDQAENGAGPAEKSTGPVWRLEWKSRKDVPYPDAIRFRWERGNQAEEEVLPLRAKFRFPASTGQ